MRIRFWGTRGSIPSPGPETVRYGGNTPCTEVVLSGERLILDAGSGIRKLGLSLDDEPGPVRATLLLTHSHWDHIQGFPFFGPAYRDENRFRIAGPDMANKKLHQILSDQMEHAYFPVDFSKMSAEMEFHELEGDALEVGDATIRWTEMNHTSPCLGYRIAHDGGVFCYMTDNELGPNGTGERPTNDFIPFCRGADLLVHDAQYSAEEYAERVGWGHSDYEEVARLAADAGVEHLAFFHYDPQTPDEELDRRVRHARRIVEERGASTRVKGAREGHVVEI